MKHLKRYRKNEIMRILEILINILIPTHRYQWQVHFLILPNQSPVVLQLQPSIVDHYKKRKAKITIQSLREIFTFLLNCSCMMKQLRKFEKFPDNSRIIVGIIVIVTRFRLMKPPPVIVCRVSDTSTSSDDYVIAISRFFLFTSFRIQISDYELLQVLVGLCATILIYPIFPRIRRTSHTSESEKNIKRRKNDSFEICWIIGDIADLSGDWSRRR